MPNKGFEKKTRVEIVDDMKAKAKNLFGSDVNLQTNSPLGIIIELVSWPMALLWSGLENIYSAYYIHTATGQDLDNLCKNIAISRINESKATGAVKFEGDDLSVIPRRTKVETLEEDPVVFETVERTVINNGFAEAEVIAVDGGSRGNLAANTLTELVNPISGVDSASNPEPTDGGVDRETDTELRERYLNSLDLAGGSTINSIRANILNNTEATACLMLQNLTLEVNEEGLPGKSFESVVLGGTDNMIADSIFEKAPAGIESHGEISKTVKDDSGNEQPVKFSRADQVNIYIKVNLNTDSDYPPDGNEQIKDEIIDYIGGITTDDETLRGLSINEDVIRTKIISRMYNVGGVKDVLNVELGLASDNLGENNINIAAREVARTEPDFIEVVI